MGTFSWPLFHVQKGALKRFFGVDITWWRTTPSCPNLCLFRMKSKADPAAQFLIFDVSGGGPLHLTAPGNAKIHCGSNMDFRDMMESRTRGPGGLFLLLLHRSDHYFIMKPRSGRAEKGTWAAMTKPQQQQVHLWQESLVPPFPQSSCRLRLSGWSGSSSCCLPRFLCLRLQKATRNISSSLLRQFPCT